MKCHKKGYLGTILRRIEFSDADNYSILYNYFGEMAELVALLRSASRNYGRVNYSSNNLM